MSFPTRSLLLTLALTPLLLLARPGQAQDYLQPGAFIDEGIGLDITEQGFNSILGLATDFLPPDLVIGSIPAQEIASIPFICDMTLAIDNLILHTDVQDISVEATPAGLVLQMNLDLWINSPEDPAIVTIECGSEYICFLYSDPANIQIQMPLTMALATDPITGEDFIDVTLGELIHNIEAAMQNKIQMTDCAIGTFNGWLSLVGLNMFDLVVAQFVTELETTLAEETANIEIQIEDALRALWIEDSTDLMGSQLTYQVEPTAVEHNDAGLRLVLGAAFSAETAPCVARFPEADLGSSYTASPIPAMTSAVPATGQAYDLAAMLSDDFTNQVLYAVWRGGAICQVVEDLGGTALTTSYLGLMLGLDYAERLDELLGGEVTMLIRVVPEKPPVATFGGDYDIEIFAQGLGIEFYPVVRDRFARLATVAIDIAVGIDLGLAPDDALQIEVSLDTDNLNPRITYNEIAEDLNPAFEENFPGFVTVIIDSVGGSALENIAFGMPTFSGIGVTSLDAYGIGNSSTLLDWLALYVGLGETTGGESSGCEGCGDALGCGGEGGCSGCGDESGCGGEGGCDLESQMAEAGCSGEGSELPGDTGCVGCRILAQRSASGKWTLRITADGIQAHKRRGFRPGPIHLILALAPILFLKRRRRSRGEF
jgi:hypothetical protein